jgi:O-antigen ligase
MLLVIVLPVLVGLVVTRRIWELLALDLLLANFTWEFELGARVDFTDLLFVGLAVAWVVRGRAAKPSDRLRVPFLGLWILLGVWASLAYLQAPVNQFNLTDPVRIAYQIYRYCWTPILYYPLAVMLLGERRPLWVAIGAAVTGGLLTSLEAIQQGYAGERASGPFTAPNAMGAAMMVPLIIAGASLLWSRTRGQRLFYALVMIALGRALFFSGSRGAFGATVVAVSFGALLLLTKRATRQRALRLVTVGVVAVAAVIALTPGLLERPTVQRMLSVVEGSQASTFQWRVEERWPHFLAIVMEHPWFGVGNEVDLSLGPNANTPHNGYLAVAMLQGIPALALMLFFAGVGISAAVQVHRRARNWVESLFGVMVASALLAILIHNIDDSTLHQLFIGKVFWLLIALATIAARRPRVLLARRATVQPVPAPAADMSKALRPVEMAS